MDGKNFSAKHDKQLEQIEKLLDERMKKPFASNLEEFFENPLSYALRPQDLLKWMDEETLLTHAVKMQKNLAAAALLHMGVDPNTPNKKGVTPISAAAHKGSIQIMKVLIQYNASVNALNTSGSTALIQASHFGHAEAVRLLLQNNASADFHNLKGTTALMRASQEGHVEISKLLIAAGADVNRKNYEGMNALMLASQRGHGAMVLLLIKAPCAMDEQTQQGSTALMLACKRGHEECVKVLVSMGAEIYTRDNRNRTARDTATRRNNVNLLPWLDTQAQIKLHQEYQHAERTQFLMELKTAYEEGRLRIDLEERNCLHLLSAFQRREESIKNSKNSRAGINNNSNNNESSEITSVSVIENENSVDMNIGYNNASSSSSFLTSVSSSLLPPPHLTIPFSVTSNIVRNNSGPVNTNTNILTWQKNNAYSTFHKDQDFFDAFIQQSAPQLPMSPMMMSMQYNNNNNAAATGYSNSVNCVSRSERETALANKISTANATVVATWDITPDMMTMMMNNDINGNSSNSMSSSTSTSVRDHPFITSVIKPVHISKYQPYEWSVLLIRSLTLPTGIFDLITEFLPLPRVWSWTLEVLKKRCNIVPQQCATDFSILMDEILADANIFKGSNQKLLVMKLNSNPHIYPLLISEWKMSATLVNNVRVWADVQSILNRAVLEYEFNLKLPMIRNMHNACMELHRWSQSRGSAYRVLTDTVGSVACANELLLKLNPTARGRKMHLGHLDDFTGTCTGYGFGSDSCRSAGLGSADDDMSVVGTETVMDQDTETELHNDLDADDTQDEDSDAEEEGGGNGGINNHHNNGNNNGNVNNNNNNNNINGGNDNIEGTGVNGGGSGSGIAMMMPNHQQLQQQILQSQQQHHSTHHHSHHHHPHSHQNQMQLPPPHQQQNHHQQQQSQSSPLPPMTTATAMLLSNSASNSSINSYNSVINNNNNNNNNNHNNGGGGFHNGGVAGGLGFF